MQRVVHKSKSFKEADETDVRQQLAMTPQQRVDAARALQRRVFGAGKDIRACHKRAAGRPKDLDALRFLEQREG